MKLSSLPVRRATRILVLPGLLLSMSIAQSPAPRARRAAPAKPKPAVVERPAAPKTAFEVPPFGTAAQLDQLVARAVREDKIPGAVLLIGHKGAVVYQKAYGSRTLVPKREPMTLDTVFDAASLTKVIATTSAVMKLYEDGKIRLNDKVTEYLPEFQGGKSDITVRNLLTHFSGLRPDVDLLPVWSGYETGVKLALIDKPVAAPGERFIYSDINFVLLGEIVHRVSGKTLAEFVAEQVFAPLGMKDTGFQPPTALRARIAPTEQVDGAVLRGIVHDPTSRYMGGVAGHAGLFTTAGDLSRFAEMMIGEGSRAGVRIFRPATVQKFTTPQTPPDQPILRGLGWDIDSPFSTTRGDLFPVGSYGHTGFTGTSLWIDPVTDSYVILLTNSVHPKRRPPITHLRSQVATLAALGMDIRVPGMHITGYNETLAGAGVRRVVARSAEVETGLDVLAQSNFTPFQGRRVGLVTNHTGRSRDGRRNIDVMLAAGVKVAALYSPEHGISGKEDREDIGNSKDATTGLPIFSLYSGPNRKPSPEMLRNVDVVVFDIQDVGVRFYTYLSTLLNVMEMTAQMKLPLYVLDRPNPITGVHVEGPMLDKELHSFVGCYELPVRHGMTIGELATMINAEEKIGTELHVVVMRNWERGDWFDSTSFPWIDLSPNMRTLNAATLYSGVAMLEYSKNYSVGRGTEAPFEQVGADWIRGSELAFYLNRRMIPGVRAYPVRFTPTDSYFKGTQIEGVRFVITDRDVLDSVRLGLELASALEKLYPGKIALDVNQRLIGNMATIQALKAQEDPRTIIQNQETSLRSFLERREKYLLYRAK